MGLHYIGNGTSIPHVPARDLSEKEAEKYGETIEAEQTLAGRVLYEPIKAGRATEAADKGKGDATKSQKENT
jgi:hypothetical protein